MESGFDMYMNSGYNNNRNRKKTLILDVDDSENESHLGSGTDFNIQLFEPLIIDKQSEVYLDNFLTFNSNIGDNPQTSAFLLRINEFNMNLNVASSQNNSQIYKSIIIPNEHKTPDNNHTSIIQKGKKFNYVCDINPGKISSISGKITDLAGAPIFHGRGADHTLTYALTGISQNLNRLIESGLEFTGITVNGAPLAAISGTFLATHLTDASTLHFSTGRALTDDAPNEIAFFVDNAGDITFTGVVGGDPTFTNSGGVGVNPNLHIVNNPGRFIAEFSIVSRE